MIQKINLIRSKTILTKTNLPGCDYVINPYNGCQFACMYCYAAQIARWKHPGGEWGSFLDVKTNAPELLKKELSKIKGSIFFSSVTDPYTSLEAKYKLTRQCLEVLVNCNYPGSISLQTKSPLVTRDIDLLKKLKNVSVGFTVTSLDDQVSRFLEVGAPPISDRFQALEELCQAGISTYAFIGPVLPYFVNNQKIINDILDKLERVGVKEVWFEHLHLNPATKHRLFEYLTTTSPQLIPDFQSADTIEYHQKLDQVIADCLTGRHLTLGLGQVIHHNRLPKKK